MVTGAFPDRRTPVVLSAHGDGLLGQDATAILAYLDGHRTVGDVVDVASTLHRTRRLRRHRAVVRAADVTELREGLAALAADDDHPLVTRATAPGRTADRGRTAFVFPGQGSQWPSMGVDAYARLREYRAEVDKCATVFASMTSASPLEYLLADPAAEVRTNDFTQVQIQGAQFVHGVALAHVWRAAGVLPDIVVGHSLGELGAAYVAGTITLSAAVGVVIARATLLDRLTGPYRVAVLGITADQAQDVIAATPGWLELSVVNSKSSVAVSGDGTAVAAAVRAVSARGTFAKEIEMWFPAHTTALDSMRAEFEALLPTGEFADAAVQFIGSATADVVKPGTPFADYWYANLRSTVRFDRAVGAAVAHGARTFVEMSAHPALLFAMDEVLDDLPDVAEGTTTVAGSGSRGEPIVERLSANIAVVALFDPAHRWSEEPRKPLPDFPFAPMHGVQLWAMPEPLPPIAGITVALEHWERIPTVVPDGRRRVALFDAGADARLADS
ncbi:MAG: mycobactin polyketide synthetase MbtD, partial [Mycobacterium sp.]|nr:mycobactin polyketide synthetase MbtD [Mycobacterium sp.]